jgi:hypothetical protein
MKAIIKGKKFDTETAKLINQTEIFNGYFGGNPATKGERYKAIFKKKTGEFFEVVYTKLYFDPSFSATIEPLEECEAKNKLETYLTVEQFEEIFGVVSE